MTAALPQDLRDLVESGPLTYVATTNADGSPQVTAIWIGLDGDSLISTHFGDLGATEPAPRVSRPPRS